MDSKRMDRADRIMIVDDDPGILKIAEIILGENGMDVITLSGGQELLSRLKEGETADLIMLDILMPEMDGFETYRCLREFEKENDLPETPVVFLTGDDSRESEAKGFELGALDFIRKPFEAEILLHRLQNILSNSRRISILSKRASTDRLTGLLNKAAVTSELKNACLKSGGALLILDLDSFKPVNDIYGHEAGDRVLAAFAKLIKHHFRANDIVGRVGGDEFIVFLKDIDDRDAIIRSINRLNSRFTEVCIRELGEDLTIPLGVSCGAVMSINGGDYDRLFERADQSLRHIKQNGKHGCFIWNESEGDGSAVSDMDDMKKVDVILDERSTAKDAMLLGMDAFGSVYRYMLRYIRRYRERACKILFTLRPGSGNYRDQNFFDAMECFSEILKETLRNSDIIMQNSSSQFFLLLPMVCSEDIQTVIDRIMASWEEKGAGFDVAVSSEMEAIEPEELDSEELPEGKEGDELHILVVDDDILILKLAGSILSEDGMWVTALDSGQALLEYIGKGNIPDLIILDVMMPSMDGFETYKTLVKRLGPNHEIPVIFLTGNDDEETELEGLRLGAVDFIRKPIKSRTLPLRVRRAIDIFKNVQSRAASDIGKPMESNSYGQIK